MDSHLIAPHGGKLADPMVSGEQAEEARAASLDWESWDLAPRQMCDLELLLSGAFSPLTGFLGRKDYESVCDGMRLSCGTLWPVPVQLDVSRELAARLSEGDMLALRSPEGFMLAAVRVEEMWEPDFEREAGQVFATADPAHSAGVLPAHGLAKDCGVPDPQSHAPS
ncbi:MAG: hypothetical protein KAX44_02760, partial [Candidatus Brocadiae bacterium]|nr:hypothetical protein [Candidatus Brocadiia bacterium]